MTADDIEQVVFLVEEDAEDVGFTASCSRWGIYTQGDDLDELRAMVKDAVDCRFADEPTQPNSIRLHFVRGRV